MVVMCCWRENEQSRKRNAPGVCVMLRCELWFWFFSRELKWARILYIPGIRETLETRLDNYVVRVHCCPDIVLVLLLGDYC
jgi:hypothetical protein